MSKLARLLSGLLLALAAPSWAQDAAPGRFPQSTMLRVDPEQVSPARRTREQAAAAEAEFACEAGDLAACAALGNAYLRGAGVPQNRPAAEVLLDEACDGGVADGCQGLGELFQHVDSAEMRALARAAFERGCALGSLDACEGLAWNIEAGDLRGNGDPESALALHRETCARGGAASCRVLALNDLSGDQSAEAEARAIAALERLCLGGDGPACSEIVDRSERRVLRSTARELRDAGCKAGIGKHCAELAETVFAEGSGPPESRAAALALFDRACDLQFHYCLQSTAIRARPEHSVRCAAGNTADCVALGMLYADPSSVLHSPAEAIALLGAACEAGASAACGTAAQTVFDRPELDHETGQARAEGWSLIGCENGNNGDCSALASRLTSEGRTPEDRERAGALMALMCERGVETVCDDLAERVQDDPAAPLPVADARYWPDDPQAIAERRERRAEERRIEQEKWRESICTDSAVTLRGITYEDRLCAPLKRVIGGYLAREGEAPWQALLWRPERVGGRRIRAVDRIACGGALVREGWILTAAHCVVDPQGRPLTGPGHRIRLGVLHALDDEGYSHPIRETFPHPRYHAPSRAFDIALVRFDPRAGSKGATTRPMARIRIDPQTLEGRQIRGGMPAYVYGWGQTALRGTTSDPLKSARLQLEDLGACERRNRFDVEPLKGALLCAGAADLSQACNGDSGGPLVTYADADAVPTVIGVVSAGTDCGQTGVTTRYTRVAKVRDWIDDVLAGRPRRAQR